MGRIQFGFRAHGAEKIARERRAHPHTVTLRVDDLPDDLEAWIRSPDVVGRVIVKIEFIDDYEFPYTGRRLYILHCNHHTTAVAIKMRWG